MNQPIIGMLHNEKNGRYHPIFFLWHPTPSGLDRYKSKAHHTEGFDTREEAVTHIETRMKPFVEDRFGVAKFCLEKDFHWDGEDTPALVLFFVETEAGVVPI